MSRRSPRFKRLLALLPLILVLAACASLAPPGVPRQQSPWGSVVTLAQTPQAAAPALLTAPYRASTVLFAAWTGADDASPRQGVSQIVGDLQRGSLLDLLAVYPHAQRITPAGREDVLLLWLDAPYGEIDAGTRLWSMVISAEGDIVRWPARVSNLPTHRYALLPEAGAAWVVWSGGGLAEPDLTIQYVDALGRPRAGQILVRGGDWPALLAAGDRRWLFWIDAISGRVLRGDLRGEALGEVAELVDSPARATGDRLVGFYAAADASHAYLFWTVARAEGTVETWVSAAPLPVNADDAPAWPEPSRLGLGAPGQASFETGFNGGAARTASPGDRWIGWAAPVSGGHFDLLPVAAEVGGALSIVYLRGGEVVAAQPVVTLSAPLTGPPALTIDRDLHLYLAWAAWQHDDYADLRLARTRR